jgi:ribonuclease PH
VQGTAEGVPFSQGELLKLLDLATTGIGELVELQKKTVT